MNRLIQTVQKTTFSVRFTQNGGGALFIDLQREIFDRKIEVDQTDMITADINDESVMFREKIWSFGKYISFSYHQAEYSSDPEILVNVKKLQEKMKIN